MDLLLNQVRNALGSLATELGVYANDVANVATPGFQQERPFTLPLANVAISSTLAVPAGATTRTVLDTAQGPLEHLGGMALAIEGPGYFRVMKEGQTFYTRLGAFQPDAAGHLVLPNGAWLLDSQGRPLVLPSGAEALRVAADGTVSVRLAGGGTLQVGRVTVFGFTNPEGLTAIGADLFQPSANSGPPTPVAVPIRQGLLEESNVDLVTALTGVMTVAKAFQAQADVASIDQQMANRLDNLVA